MSGQQFFDDELKAIVDTGHALGRKVTAHAHGTDSYVSQYGRNAREFGLLVEAGLTPVEAIVAATVKGARNLGQPDHLGTLEAGKYADVIAVAGDPTTDISGY